MSEYCKVLIVDDEFIMRQGMKHMLEWEKQGFQIVGEASNGQEGLALVEELKPHIVLADIVMPIIDGIEFSEIMGKKYPSIQLIMLSSYDKFEYVKTTLLNGAADYILKPTLNPDVFLKTLKRAAERILGFTLQAQEEIPHANQIEKMLLGFQDKLDEVIFVNLFPNTLYRLLAIDLRQICGKSKEDLISARRMIEEFYQESGEYAVLPVFMEEGNLCLVLNYRVKEEGAVIVDAQALGNKMQRLYPRTFFVMSRGFSNMQKIRLYYQQDIEKELHNGFYYPAKYLKIVEDYQEKETVQRFEFEAYTRHLNQGRHEEALRMFEHYMEYLCEKQMEEFRLKNLAKNLLYNFLMEIEKYSIESEELRERYFREIDTVLYVDIFQSKVLEITQEIRHMLAMNKGVGDSRILEIKKYVAVHYKEPLELSDIAEKFNFNYNYLSSYFSQTTQEGFNEYLNKIRIEHACQLLEQPNLPISGISGSVGYSDQSYFCRVFKKITGETPSSFRRRKR